MEDKVAVDHNDLEQQRRNWFKYVNKVIMTAVCIRFLVDIIGLSLMAHTKFTNQDNSSSVTVVYIALLTDIALILIFSTEYRHDIYYWYFRLSLIISIFLHYHINTTPMLIICIITFISNLKFLWILELTKINVFKTTEANKWMYNASKLSKDNIPDRLKGIFYMDGNPVKEDLLVFENGDWDKDHRTLTLQNINNYNWSFEYNEDHEGLKALEQTKIIGFNYKIHFDERIANGNIDLYAHCCPIPKCLYNLTFEEIEGDDKSWNRRTTKCKCFKDTICHDRCYYNKVYIMRKVYDKDRNLIDDSFEETISTYCIATL